MEGVAVAPGREGGLLVVFGAGASYDSFPQEPAPSNPESDPVADKRLPLTDDLFEENELLVECRKHTPSLLSILHRLQNRGASSLEQVLNDIDREAEDYTRHREALIAVRYCLQQLIGKAQKTWMDEVAHGNTNHVALLYRIDRWLRRGSREATLVTFNYDTLIEHALRASGETILGLESQPDSVKLPLIKPHGSIDWYYRSVVPKTFAGTSREEPEFVAKQFATIQFGEEPVRGEEIRDMSVGAPILLPAMALPLTGAKKWVCPPAHETGLLERVKRTDRVLVVGWKGADEELISMLKDHLQNKEQVRLVVVAATNSEAADIRHGIEARTGVGAGGKDVAGFSRLMREVEPLKFLLG